MDFFDRQDQARRSTTWLVVYFVAGVALLIVAVYLATLLIFTGAGHHRHHHYGEPAAIALWNPKLFSGVAVCTLAVIALGSLFKTLQLARGGSAVATMLGGWLVNPNTTDPDERKLLNVVEEMAIASGVPVPQVYILPEEQGINAFAAGHSTSDAVIGVTDGCMRLLTRDELQGVIGHEFSHILNGDMRLNLRLMGIIFGILCLTVIGRILLRTRGRKNPLPVLGLALVIIGWIGVFFGHLIQAAVSRQREFLADASAVQFTRNPAGLAGALKKIGGLSYGSRLETAHAEEASHLFFGNGTGNSFLNLMATHPPLAERIRALEPDFNGLFPRISPAEVEPVMVSSPPRRKPSPFPFPLQGHGHAAVVGLAAPPVIVARSVLTNAGAPTTAHLRYAEELRNAIPARLEAAARDSLGASALIYGLLLSDDEATRLKQLAELAGATSSSVCQETQLLWSEVQALPTHARLPLVDLTLPALRQLSPRQFQQFRAALQVLVESDGEIDLFEYVLQKVVLRHLEPHFTAVRKPVVQYYAIKPLADDCAILLSGLAHMGHSDPSQIELSFQQGAQPLSYAAQAEISLLPAAQCELSQVDAALNRLAQAVPQIKKNVLTACAQTVAADGVIQELEAELLRAIADTLDCPLPPFISKT